MGPYKGSNQGRPKSDNQGGIHPNPNPYKSNKLIGSSLYNNYPNLASALQVAYPDYNWIHCIFNKSPRGAWKDPKHLQDFFEYCSLKLHIKALEDWYQVTRKQIQLLGGIC